MTAKILASGLIASVMVLILGMNGCPPTDGNGIITEEGTLEVLVTDNPFPYDLLASATVTITRMDVRSADDEETFITIFEGERSFNLLELQNGQTDLLAETEIVTGSYSQIRLFVSDGRVVLTDQREFDLTVPSGDASGIKINVLFDIQPDETTQLLLDVDLRRSFRPIPSGTHRSPTTIENFMFQPSVGTRAIQMSSAGRISGQIVGHNSGSIANATVTAIREGREISSTSSTAAGSYLLIGLPVGTYTIDVEADGFEDAQVSGIQVIPNQQTQNVNVTMTATPD